MKTHQHSLPNHVQPSDQLCTHGLESGHRGVCGGRQDIQGDTGGLHRGGCGGGGRGYPGHPWQLALVYLDSGCGIQPNNDKFV